MNIMVLATVTLLEDDCAVVSFEHPDYGSIEREIHASSLPSSAKIGDTVNLSVEKIRSCRTLTIVAEIEWFDSPDVIVSFEHPTLGRAERPFKHANLPIDANIQDEFDLVIELDASGKVSGYNPQRNRLKKHVLEEWEKIPRPKIPDDLNDKEALDRYLAACDEHTSLVIKMRMKAKQNAS